MDIFEERFWAKVQKTDNCWWWTGATCKGYGHIKVKGRTQKAHRVSYEMHIGPIPAGLTLDHECQNPLCVRPDHLEPVTHAENIRRATKSPPAVNRRKTHCPQGHEYDLVEGATGRAQIRRCRECRRAQQARSAREKRAARRAELAAA